MKKGLILPAVAFVTMGALFGCSNQTLEADSVASIDSNGASGTVLRVSTADAQAHLAGYRRSVVGSWWLSDSTSDTTQTVSVDVDSTLQDGDFAVEAEVQVEDDSTFTVASAGVDGDGAAWMIQVEDGAVVFSWRDNAEDEWQSFKTEKSIEKNKLANVRMEHAGKIVVFMVDGKILAAFEDDGRKKVKVKGSFTIGFDSKEHGKCHCKNGHVEQAGVETVDEIEEADIDSVLVVDTLSSAVDAVIEVDNDSVPTWIAEWDFNDSENVGRDATGNGHKATIGEGSVSSVDGIAGFDGKSGFTVKLDDKIKINEFVVEARVKPTKFGTMQNIIVAEPPGRGVDGWQLRVDEGVLTVHLRDTDKDADDWTVFPGAKMNLDEWTEIRFERNADSVRLFQNGELTVAEAYTGDLTQMAYDWSIGYDGMQQAFHNRYFIGEMDYVRFGLFKGFTVGVKPAGAKRLLAAWEFNEPTFIGLDRMANNSTHYLVGNPQIADTTVSLDSASGLQVNLSKVFQRNTFAIEARVKPAKFGEMQNIIAAEPPGRYGDGWVVRVDDGVLKVQFRDEDADGTQWNVFTGDPLALDEWTEIRVERDADNIKVFQDGKLTVNAATKGDVSQLRYDIGIGYDAMMQAKHDRFFVGEIDYIRYYGL